MASDQVTHEPNLSLPPVDDRLENIRNFIKEDHELDTKLLPGLAHLLDEYLDPNVPVSNEDYLRRLLKVFRKSTDNTYEEYLGGYSKNEQVALEAFVKGKPASEVGHGLEYSLSMGARQELGHLHESSLIESLKHELREAKENVEEFFGKEAKEMTKVLKATDIGLREDETTLEVYKDVEFQNWGQTVENKPCYTCIPRTTLGVQNILKFAKAMGLGVRCSGYRHSWSPVFARNGGILISTLNLKLATEIPNFTSLGIGQEPPKELNSITLLPEAEQPTDGQTRLVRVGCATTNEQLREWCIQDKVVTLPLNVIMVEITLGGSNAPICHGAGRKHQTLSDLVYRIEYVDANGEARMIDHTDKEFLAAASGCFGLMGVVTHITLKFERMSYAHMKPVKLPVVQAIPPPPGYIVPPALQPKLALSAEQMAAAQADFEKRASDDYYAEWFWFPYSDFAWVNTWVTTNDPADVADYPNSLGKVLQLAGTLAMQVLQETAALTKTQQWFSLTRTTLISRAAMMNLPPYETPFGNALEDIKTWVPNALHFQRAIQNVRVRDIEVEIPLVPTKADPQKVDWTYVQRAWWDAILHAYRHTDTCPQRFPLEMRTMGGSNVVMAPQRGNTLGTCSIEILTLMTEKDRWVPYAQELLDTWMSYKDHNGKLLNTRPHWAKEWAQFAVNGKPWLEYLKEVSYKNEIKEFKEILAKIGERHNWTLADLKARFSNEMFDKLFFDDVDVPLAAKRALVAGQKIVPTIPATEVAHLEVVN